MARDFEIKTKTFFQIPPRKNTKKDRLFEPVNRVVFMDVGFDLDDISLITECGMLSELWYQFKVHTGYSEQKVLTFDFRRKSDCLMAQRELSRAWTKTGEFADDDEDVPAGEGSSTT